MQPAEIIKCTPDQMEWNGTTSVTLTSRVIVENTSSPVSAANTQAVKSLKAAVEEALSKAEAEAKAENEKLPEAKRKALPTTEVMTDPGVTPNPFAGFRVKITGTSINAIANHLGAQSGAAQPLFNMIKAIGGEKGIDIQCNLSNLRAGIAS